MTRFRLHKDSLSNSRMANTFRNNILRTELRLNHRKMKTLHRQIEDMESSIYGFQSIFTFFSKTRIRAFINNFSVKCTHNRKLSDLGLHNTDDINDSAIYNDIDVIFSEDEISLLSKGLKFSYFPDRIYLKKVQAEFENLFIQLSPHIRSQNHLIKLKVCLANGYSNFVSSFFFDRRMDRNFSKNIHGLISSIREKVEKYNLVVIKTDKGNTVIKTDKGNTVIKTDKGNTVIKADKGNTVFKADKGNTVIKTDKGNTVIKTYNGNTVIKADKGNTVIKTDKGNTVIKADKGNTVIKADKGNTVIKADKGNTVIKADKGNTVIKADKGNTVIKADKGNTVIKTDKGNTVIKTDKGNTVIKAGKGNTVSFNAVKSTDRFELVVVGQCFEIRKERFDLLRITGK